MRWSLFRHGFAIASRRIARRPFAQCFYFTAKPSEFIAEFQHRPVLLGHVPLQVGNLFFEPLDPLVQGRDGSLDAACVA